MKLERTSLRTNALLLFAVLAAPLAWTLQLVLSSELEEGGCRLDAELSADRWHAAITGGALLVTLAAGIVAVLLVREVRRSGGDDRGRIAFMAYSSLLVTGVFSALIVLGGIGALALDTCAQS